MPIGQLLFSPVIIQGLAQNGYPNSIIFIEFYVSPSEKQRTESASGPEPSYHNTFECYIRDKEDFLSLELINEDPTRPGHIGSTRVSLKKVFDAGFFEDWVPLSTTTGGPLGHLYIKLAFTVSITITR
ncbi:uncharacterized protein BX663DRAFT_510429 [Cokeromyces recurvatus]|uniref:uncharacterized protein n=1 Tax=Cokeromyces recurvatus TaxID=90255 RepID=UPI00221FAAEF|nr:uncharacterized protein BX663DRAFT_510429 [Cokeromyces recurvatus]KAI7902771.1 hypothetical protein BX663DRAFT_510429 [Cokeromyces recurvatus]